MKEKIKAYFIICILLLSLTALTVSAKADITKDDNVQASVKSLAFKDNAGKTRNVYYTTVGDRTYFSIDKNLNLNTLADSSYARLTSDRIILHLSASDATETKDQYILMMGAITALIAAVAPLFAVPVIVVAYVYCMMVTHMYYSILNSNGSIDMYIYLSDIITAPSHGYIYVHAGSHSLKVSVLDFL